MNKKNLANAQLLTGINSSVTTATVKSGQGSVLPAAPFFATLSPVGVLSTIDNSEIVEVTGKSADTLTIVRAQRGTTAKSFVADALVVNGIYVEDLSEGTWGSITGTLSDQTDLNSALSGKAASSHTHATTDLTATGGSSTSFLRKDNTWATPTNTTYSEITSAEVTAGTASTARAISGRRAQEIVNKARTGVVKSTTTSDLTASATAPASPAAGDVWFDTNNLPEDLAPTSIVWKEVPTGAVNGTNTAFSASQAYISGSLQVFINGLAESGLVTESSPGTGGFTLTPAPLTGDNLSVQYQVRTTGLGNADTVDGYHANATPTANNIPVLNGSAKLPYNITSVQSSVDANGWTVITKPDGKRVWLKSGVVSGISLPAGISFGNGTSTAMPVGVTGANLYSSAYVVTDSLVLGAFDRHIVPHTIYGSAVGDTAIQYGIINLYSGGSWTGNLRYGYQIEEI